MALRAPFRLAGRIRLVGQVAEIPIHRDRNDARCRSPSAWITKRIFEAAQDRSMRKG